MLIFVTPVKSWFSRDVTNFQCSKPGGLQKFYLHLRKDFLKIYIFTIPWLDIVHSFDNRTISISEFSSCVTTGGRLCQSCSVLQNDSSRDFQHSKQCKYKEKYLSKFSKAHKRKQTSLLAKVNSRLFFSYFRPPCWCPSEGHQHGVSIQSSINLCGILCQITRVRKTVQT